jgi:hypothetical protein
MDFHCWISFSTVVISGIPTMNGSHNHGGQEEKPTRIIINIHSHVFSSMKSTNVPFKGREYRCRSSCSANSQRLITPSIAEQGSKCNPSSEPEYHGENLYRKNAELVCDSWVPAWSPNQVDENQDRPDSAEEHVVGFSR